MLNLINNLDKELSSIEGLPERYRRLVTRISRVFQVHDLTADFHTALNQLGEGDLDLLEECQEKLAHYRPEEVADQQALEDLWQDVTALYEEIMVAPLDRELKEFILGQLESIRRAIHEYRVGGIERLRSALATNLGELFLHKELLQKYKENEFLRKTVMFSYKLGSIVTFGADLTTMIGNVAPHILRLTSGGLS
jgi:DNA repair exonuclease SbcCD ATPase subunit